MDTDLLVDSALGGDDRRALARLLRVVEDRRPGWEDVLARAWSGTRPVHLVGITGAPGVGKSTLANGLISAWRAVDRAVAVVAVDPSSPFTGGALLGDRIRMQEHVGDEGVFIRSMASRGRLGGLAEATAGLVTVLEAARFDPVVIETVGVGQSEVEVVEQADTVVVVVTPGWGDGVQTEKAGLLEIGDVFVVNKADRPEVADTRRHLTAMLEGRSGSGWTPPVVETVATEQQGIEILIDALDRHRRHLATGAEGRSRQLRRARSYIRTALAARIDDRLDEPDLSAVVERVRARRLDPWSAATEIAFL